jgi:hypothetical protein
VRTIMITILCHGIDYKYFAMHSERKSCTYMMF